MKRYIRAKTYKYGGKTINYNVGYNTPDGRYILFGGSPTLDGAEKIFYDMVDNAYNNLGSIYKRRALGRGTSGSDANYWLNVFRTGKITDLNQNGADITSEVADGSLEDYINQLDAYLIEEFGDVAT